MTRGIVFGAGFIGRKIAGDFDYDLSRARVSLQSRNVELERALDSYPEVVINAIGKTHGEGVQSIDYCETHKEETRESNTFVPWLIARECAKRGIYFVHLGSGCIYQGDNHGEGFSEEDMPNFYGPQFYAMTKIDAERLLTRDFNSPILQVRIRMPIDDKTDERNLIDKLVGYNRVIDIKNSMTTIPFMLKALRQLIARRREGIYNVVNEGAISPYEIMEMYKEIVNPRHRFERMPLEELDKTTLAKRSNCKLSVDKLKREGIDVPEIHESVRECLTRYKSQR
ncbi:MAG: sugar nucleotide-binding protein [Parcubacteria group bacterium]|jgi:dTDP-4-dehydrorhamnose reductase